MSSILGHSTWWTGKVIPKICLWKSHQKGAAMVKMETLMDFTKGLRSFFSPTRKCEVSLHRARQTQKTHCLKSLSHKLPHLPAVATTWQKKQRQGIFAHLFIRIDGLSLDIDICLIFQFSSLQGLIHPRKANVMAPQMQTLICLHLDECFTSQESSQGFIFRKGSRIFACYTLASSHSCKASTCTAKQYTSQTASKTKNIGIWPSHFANSKRWKCGGYRSSISS